MRKMNHCVALLAALALPAAQAEELFPTTSRVDARWGLGLGMLYEDEGYRDGSAEAELLPVFFYQGKRLRILGPQAEFRVWDRGGWSASLRGEYRFDGFEPGDEPLFTGMAEREASFHLGAELKHEADWGHVTMEYLQSLSASEGYRASVYYARPFTAGEWTIMPKVGLERYDAKFTNYYYGVRADEATTGRPRYEAGASTNVDVGIDLQRAFGRHVVLGSVKYRAFGSAIKDSPLVEDSGSARLTLAYMYTF